MEHISKLGEAIVNTISANGIGVVSDIAKAFGLM